MNLRKEISKRLKKNGFKAFECMHLFRIDPEFSFCVDTGPFDSHRSDISPFIGLRSDTVETLFGRFLGVPDCDSAGTVGGNVGYVLDGQYRHWESTSNIDEIYSTIAAGLERYRPYASLAQIEHAWGVIPFLNDPDKSYRQVVIAVINKRYDRVPMLLDEARKIWCKYENEVAAQFRGFEKRVLEYALQ